MSHTRAEKQDWWGDEVTIDDEIFYMQSKLVGEPPSQDALGFALKNWYEPMEQYAGNANLAFTMRDMDIVRNMNGEIIALSAYSIVGNRGSTLELFVVQDNYKKRGLGQFLATQAINRIIQGAADTQSVEVLVSAHTVDGMKLLRKMAAQFGERIKMKVDEVYKNLNENNLPEDLHLSWAYRDIEFDQDSLATLAHTYADEVYNDLSQEERDTLELQVLQTMQGLIQDERAVLVMDHHKVVAMVGYEPRGKDNSGDEVIELVFSAVQPTRQREGIGKILLQVCEKTAAEEGDTNAVSLVSKNPQVLRYAKERGYEEIPLKNYFDGIHDPRAEQAEVMERQGFHALIKHPWDYNPYKPLPSLAS